MNITDQLDSLFEKGVVSLHIALSPEGKKYIQAGQVVKTGPGANHSQHTHQVSDASIPEMLNTIAKQVHHANEMIPSIIELPKRGN